MLSAPPHEEDDALPDRPIAHRLASPHDASQARRPKARTIAPSVLLVVVVLVAAALALPWGATIAATDGPETMGVASMPEAGPHWVWVPDRLLRHSLLYDGDTGDVLGMVDSGQQLTPKTPLWSRERGEIYSADIAYSRGSRGRRLDFVSIYDSRSLEPVGEVLLPTRTGESNASLQYAEMIGERFLGVFNQFPVASVSIVDLAARRFIGEIPIAGCAGVYPVGPRAFATLCGDGRALRVDLDAIGRRSADHHTATFFDTLEDPVAMSAGRNGTRWTFVSFAGQVHTVDFGETPPAPEEAWSLVDDGEKRDGWRPGGLQSVALHAPSGRLFVVMHQGQPGSHKAPGPEIWVFDLAKRERVLRIEAPNVAVPFLAPFLGIGPDDFARRVLDWVVPSPGVHSIAVSSDDEPVLFARNAELGVVAVIDANSGETLRILDQAGLAGPTLRVP